MRNQSKMQAGQFKELWEIRFRKIWDGEKEALIFYKGLLNSHPELLQGTRAKEILEEIKRDEAKHARIAYELLRLVRNKQSKQRYIH